MNEQTWMLFGGIGALLLLASLVGFVLKWRAGPGPNAVIDNLNARINAWWAMVLVIGFAFWLGQAAVILLFYGVSFYALREFITLTPTRRSDYPALVAAFYFVLPMQYLLIYIDWYSMFSIFIPVYVFLLLPILASLGGDTKHFLERASKASLPYRRPGPLAGRRQPRIPRPRRRPGEDPRQPGRTRRSTRPPRRASRRTRRRGRGTRFGGTRHAPGRLLRGCGGTRPRSIARRTFGDAAGLHAASLLRAHRQPPAQRQRQARPPATAGTAGTGGGGCAAHGDRGRTGGGVGRCPRRGGGRRARRLLRPRRRLDPDAAHPRRRTAARPGLRTRRPDAQPDGGGPRRVPGASARGAKLPALRTGFRSRQAAPGRAGGRLPDQPAATTAPSNRSFATARRCWPGCVSSRTRPAARSARSSRATMA